MDMTRVQAGAALANKCCSDCARVFEGDKDNHNDEGDENNENHGS